MENKSNTGLILTIAGIGIGAALILPKIAKAAAIPKEKLTENTTITPDKTQIINTTTGEVLAWKETVSLKDIPDASWKVPLFVTIERNISLGFWGAVLDIAQSAGSAVISGVSTVGSLGLDALKTAGSAVGSALGGISNVVTGTVIPAISDIGSGIATVIKPVAGTVLDVGSAVWDLASSVGSKTWDVVSGAAEYVVKNPEAVQAAVGTVATVAATVQAVKSSDQSQVATTQTQVAEQQRELPESQTFQAGLLSQTPFNTEYGASLIVKKLYNPQLKDTALATNAEAIRVLGQVGYQVQETLGYCSPGPFLGSVPMIMLFNENTVDHLLITNTQAVSKFETIGYKSLGTIGYCKAVQTTVS